MPNIYRKNSGQFAPAGDYDYVIGEETRKEKNLRDYKIEAEGKKVLELESLIDKARSPRHAAKLKEDIQSQINHLKLMKKDFGDKDDKIKALITKLNSLSNKLKNGDYGSKYY